MRSTKRRVLIIDDEAELLKPLAEAFRARGIEVDVLTNPTMAEAYISRAPFDAIITDFKMAHVDGADIVKTVRQSLLNRLTPVVVISAYVDRPMLAKLQPLGVQGVLVKPFRSIELVTRVTALFAAAG